MVYAHYDGRWGGHCSKETKLYSVSLQDARTHGPVVDGYLVQLWRTGTSDGIFTDPATECWPEVPSKVLLVVCPDPSAAVTNTVDTVDQIYIVDQILEE